MRLKYSWLLYRVAERMNPKESGSKIVVYGKEILMPSFGRGNPTYPLKIGKFFSVFCKFVLVKYKIYGRVTFVYDEKSGTQFTLLHL